jgi:hypothetical protein
MNVFCTMRVRFARVLTSGLVSAACISCGPRISEVTMAHYPPKDPNCDLEFVQIDMRELFELADERPNPRASLGSSCDSGSVDAGALPS